MSNLEHARKYIAKGWSVFPVPFKQKIPAKGFEWGDYRERYATDEELVKWFQGSSNGVAIVCGKLSNLSILDADGIKGISDIQRLNLSSVGTIITGGGGRHLLFKYGGEINKRTSVDHEGLDVRGEGGYVVAPPSTHETGALYRWANGIPNPQALSEFPKGIWTEVTTIQNGVSTQTSGIIPVTGNNPDISTYFQGADKGQRHTHLVKLACYLIPRHSYEVTKTMLLEWNKKNSPPLADDEVIKQLNDLTARFTKGQYKSNFPGIVKEVHYVEPEKLEISTSSADGDTYIADVLNPSNTGQPELPTGFATIDEATWGVRRGAIVCIGARPGVGKTSFTVNIIASLSSLNKRVLYFSTECTPPEIYNSIFASQAGINKFNLENKRLDQGDRAKLVAFLPKFKSFDIHVVKLFRPDISSVRDAINQVNPDIVVVDHLQHLAEGDKQFAMIDKFVKWLKETAVNKNIAVIVCSQLHRGAAQDGVVPELHHLKGCGTIEEESSIVILLHSTSKDVSRPVLFRIAKNRHGRTGDTTLLFDASITKFGDMGVKVS